MVRGVLIIIGAMMAAAVTTVQCDKIDSLLRANQRVMDLLSRLNEHVANSRARTLADGLLTGEHADVHDVTLTGHKPSLRWLVLNNDGRG